MRIFVWLLRAAIFLILFAFALNNQHEASVRWFFASEWRSPTVFVLLAAFLLGGLFGVLAMFPTLWRYRRLARKEHRPGFSQSLDTGAHSPSAASPPKLPPPDGL